MTEVRLHEVRHPDPAAQATFDALVGITPQKQQLLDELAARLDPDRIARWEKRHHPKGLALAKRWTKGTPLVLLSGDVGCGKSELAGAVGTPLAKAIGKRVVSLETPSDLRGWGHVGELSARVTEAFTHARKRAQDEGAGILVIDEADDVATARAQMQAHHEDRAGLNVLIKQLDQLARDAVPLAVLLITNRSTVLDPAVRRRTGLHLKFARPDASARAEVFSQLLVGVDGAHDRIGDLLAASERGDVPFSYSDFFDRLARAVLRAAQEKNEPVSIDLFLHCLEQLEPSPLMETRE